MINEKGVEEIAEILYYRERRKTIAFLGLDIHINPDIGIRLIEMNGCRSGYSGLEQVTGRDVTKEIFSYLRRFGLDIMIDEHEGLSDDIPDIPRVNIDKAYRYGFVRSILPREFRRFALPKIPAKIGHSAIVWNFCGDVHIFDENCVLSMNPYAIETASGDKEVIRNLAKGLEMMPRGFQVRKNSKDIGKLEDICSFNGRHVVIKPIDGYQGRHVIVVEKDEVMRYGPSKCYNIRSKGAYEPNLIVEELVPNRSLMHNGSKHFATMRYLVIVHSDKGRVKLKHFGGYWRVAKAGIDSSLLNSKYVINLSRNAIPLRVSDQELSMVKDWIDEKIPLLYRRLLRLPINEKPDDFCNQLYLI